MHYGQWCLISRLGLQLATFSTMAGGMDCVTTVERKAPVKRLKAQGYLQGDKAVFTELLQYVAADMRGDRPLASNEGLLRLIPVLCAYFTHEEVVALLGEPLTDQVMEMYRAEMLQNLFLESELRRVVRTFNEAGIPLMLFKGPVLAYTIYPRPHLRTYHDIDAFIHPEDVERAHDALTRMGYSFYEEYRADPVDKQRTGYHFSLQRPGLPFAVVVELHTAPHGSEIGTRFDCEALWRNADTMTIVDQSVATMNPVDHLLYLCWHYRFHGFTRLLWFYDLVMMLRTYNTTLEWGRLIDSARRQHLAATLYYCLSWCRAVFGVAIPETVLEQLRPSLASRLVVERIALPNVLRDLSVARYREHRLIARRAMVDSNQELLKAGLRMLFPSPVALQKRYMERSRLPLRFFPLFYLIHPWLTLAKGCRILFKHQRKSQRKKDLR